MKLYYELKEEQKRLVQSDPSEELWYCVPLDLTYDYKEKKITRDRANYIINKIILKPE